MKITLATLATAVIIGLSGGPADARGFVPPTYPCADPTRLCSPGLPYQPVKHFGPAGPIRNNTPALAGTS